LGVQLVLLPERGRVSSPGDGRTIFLTMDLVQGETLAGRLRRTGRMSTDEALLIATQMAIGPAAAHRAGVMHRDLKPENVVLEPPRAKEPFGRAVITDFGLARATTNTSHSVPGLDETWETTILRCLIKDPSRRNATADEVFYALGGDISISSPRIGMTPLRMSSPGDERLALHGPLSEDPRIDILEARSAPAVNDFPRERAAPSRGAAKAEKLGARLLVARARQYEAWALSLMGDNPGALAAYEEAWRICEGAGHKECIAISLEGMGSLREEQGKLEEARMKLESSLALRRELGAESSQLSTMANLALVMQRQGDIPAARKANQEVLKLSRRLNIRLWTAYAMLNLAHLAQRDRDLEQAEKGHEDALAIFRQVHDGRAVAECLGGLGQALLRRGELEKAEARVNDGLVTLKALGIKDGMNLLLSVHGALRRHRGDLPAARRSHTEALALANELGERGAAAGARLSLAELGLDEGRVLEAETLARQAIEEFVTHKQDASESRAARVQGAVPENAVRAARTLESRYREIPRLETLPLAYEARLALGELTLASGHAALARRDLKTLAKEARSRQFTLIARKALKSTEK